MAVLNWDEIESKRKSLGWSRRDLAKFLGVSEKTLNNWKNGGEIKSARNLIELFLKADSEDGISESLFNPVIVEVERAQKQKIVDVPIVSQYAYGGYLSGYADNEYISTLPTVPFVPDREMTGNYVAFEVHGDSMDNGTKDGFIPGELVICREVEPYLWKDSKLHIHKRDFVIVHKDGILIKRISEHDVEKHTITIHSLNPEYPDRTLDLADVRQIFSIVSSQIQRGR